MPGRSATGRIGQAATSTTALRWWTIRVLISFASSSGALPELLHRLADIKGLTWIRLHYAYPSKFPLEILDVMREALER